VTSVFFQNIVTDINNNMYADRLFCGHLYHRGCLDKYMKTPPFHGELVDESFVETLVKFSDKCISFLRAFNRKGHNLRETFK